MTNLDLLDSIGNAKGAYILQAQQHRRSKPAPAPKRLNLKRTWLIAAIISLMLLLVGCVAYVLSLEDLIFGETVRENIYGEMEEKNLFSIQGIAGTPGYMASKEWYEWEQAYDPDLTIYHSEEAFSEDFGEAYYSYSLYTREMKDKLDEICKKYGLALLGRSQIDPTEEGIYEAVGITSIFKPEAKVESDLSGYYYRDGTFKLEGNITLTAENTPWPQEELISFFCHNKKSFSDLYASVGAEGTYEEWVYTNADGFEILMLLTQYGSKMLVDEGNYVFIFSTSTFLDEDAMSMTRDGLEAIAEVLDFSIQPQSVSDEAIAASQRREQEQSAALYAELNNRLHSYRELGYDSRIKFHIENSSIPDRLGFALMDLDGNGTEELIIGENGYILTIYTHKENGTQQLIASEMTLSAGLIPYNGVGVSSSLAPTYMYLCEDNSIALVSDFVDDSILYQFARLENGEYIWAERLLYLPNQYPDGPWLKRTGDSIQSESITEAEFKEIVASYVRKPIPFAPISVFPLADDSPSGIGKPAPVYASYAEFIESRKEWLELTDDLHYALLDLDNDGQEELFWQEQEWKGIFGMVNSQVKMLVSGENLFLCENNIIRLTHNYLDGNSTHSFYKVENGKAVLVEHIRYDAGYDPGNKWFQSADGHDTSLVLISEDQFQSILNSYPSMDISLSHVSEFPLE